MHRRLTLLIVVMAALVIGSMALAAEPATTPADEGAKSAASEEIASRTLWDQINAGGTIGWVIMLLGVVALGFAIEDGITIRRSVIMPPEVLAEIEECFEKEEYERAITVCEEKPTFFTNVIAAGLARINGGYTQMEEAMAEAGEEAATNLQHKLGYLALISNVAPMLGLLGTVQGMIVAFQKVAMSAGAPKPAELADAIQLALVTTFQGLVVAIPVMCAFQFFKNKVQKMIIEIGAITGELMARFRPVE